MTDSRSKALVEQPPSNDSTLDFIAAKYALIGEPLNLHTSRPWLVDVYEDERPKDQSLGLVLGGTPWLGELLRRTQRCVVLVDKSKAMLRMSAAATEGSASTETKGELKFIQGDWLSLPHFPEPASIVLGDNSFAFLPYPEAWVQVVNQLADRMSPGGKLIIRTMSVPLNHRTSTPKEIAFRYQAQGCINYTEVRTALLLAHWNRFTYGIHTEEALATFEANWPEFKTLLKESSPEAENDLVTMRKYKGTGAVYYAPPLEPILDLLRIRFRITAVHFGPYDMFEYFPLIVAVRSSLPA